MNINTNENVQDLRKKVHDFAIKEIQPVSEYWDRMTEPRGFPFYIYKKLGACGFLGYNTPIEYGGHGKTTTEFVTILEELSYVDGAFGLMCEIARLVTLPILLFGTSEQKDKYISDCVSGKIICAFAMSEPEAGSDASNIQTIAARDGSEYVISGEKMFITHGDVADLAIVFCKIKDHKKLSAFIVDTNQVGWKSNLLKIKMGIRACTTSRVILDNVVTSEDNLIGESEKGLQYAMISLDHARVYVASQSIGVARRALDESITYSKSRIAFGVPLAKLQAIQWMLADMATKLEAARLLTCKSAILVDQCKKFTLAAAQAKLFASETAAFCVDRAMQIHGGYGYIGELSVIEKLYRDQRFLEIGEGTSEIQRIVIVSNLLKKNY